MGVEKMSGIYIPGAKIPDGEYVRVLMLHKDGTCVDGIGNVFNVIPVPPHGDLIDCDAYRDEFMNGVYELCDDDSDNYRANAIIDLYDSAPAVIPASKEG